jgi:RimJ/RimL family protein N-acetyltransferase
MNILETERLILLEIVEQDAEFIYDLVNQPSFVKYIGNRNVHSIETAREFIENRYRQNYREHGFGLYAVDLKENNTPIGICGFVKRDTLPDADIGFAFLPQYERQGFAFESTDAVMKYGREALKLEKVLAITTQDNESSGKLLEKLGFQFEGLIKQPNDEAELKLFSFEYTN